jgi:hypothetical protein
VREREREREREVIIYYVLYLSVLLLKIHLIYKFVNLKILNVNKFAFGIFFLNLDQVPNMLNKLIIKSMIYAKRLFFKIVFSIFQEMLNHAIYLRFFFLFFFHVIFVVFFFKKIRT